MAVTIRNEGISQASSPTLVSFLIPFYRTLHMLGNLCLNSPSNSLLNDP